MQLGSTQRASVALAFGPISVNVSVHSAVAEDKEASLRLVCTNNHELNDLGGDGGYGYVPASRVTSCPLCGSTEHIGRAKQVADGLVPIPETILDAAKAAEEALGKEIRLHPHPIAEVEELTRPTGARYYVNVKSGSSNNYALLRAVLERTPDIAYVAHFSLKGAGVPYRLMLDGDALTLVQLADPANVRLRPKVSGDVDEVYLAWALTLAEEKLESYDPAAYARPKTAILNAYVEGKAPLLVDLTDKGNRPTTGNVGDLLDALKASVAEARRAKAPAKAPAKKAPARTAKAAPKTSAKASAKTPAKAAPKRPTRKAS